MEDNDLKNINYLFTSEVSCRTLSHLSSISAMRWTELTRISDAILSAFPRAGNWWRRKKGRKYYMDLGQISHYLADYFTYPHNKIYPGSLKDHCSYEEKLKRDLRRYIRTDAAKPHKADHLEFNSARNLCDFIQKSHDDYLVRKHDVEDDIHHIVEVNYKAMETMIHLLAEKRAEFRLKHS